MMGLDMRALYYIALGGKRAADTDIADEDEKANENMLNQNFGIISKKIYDFEARLNALEAKGKSG